MQLLTLSIILFPICPVPKYAVNCKPTYESPQNSSSSNNFHANQAKTPSLSNVSENSVNRVPVKLNMKQGLAMNQILDIYTLAKADNRLCRNQSWELREAMRAFEPWALQNPLWVVEFVESVNSVLVFDSSSKLQAAILQGNLFEFGAYEQCINIYKDTIYGPIRGKYCSLRIRPDTKLLRKILEFRNISSKRFAKVYQFVSDAEFAWAICVPASCPAEQVLQHFSAIIYSYTEGLDLNISLSEHNCDTVFSNKALTKFEICILGVLFAFVAIVAICTLMELFYLTPSEVSSNNFVSIFSAYSNSKQIFSKGKSSDLDCVHGIRFLSTCYVVIGHRYLMMMFFPVINSLKIMDWVLYYRSTAITGGTLCVDTFFMVSGMLVSVGFFKEMTRSGKMNWMIFYLYRYFRITPPLAITVLCYATLIQHLGSGPLWHDMLEIVQKPCQEYWWATILHIQNYVHPYPLCMTQAWYLTCDMQYYLFSPIILIPLWKNQNFGCVNMLVIYILSVWSSFYFAWINRYSGGVPVTNQLFSTKYFQHHYITPHTRASTYIIGLAFGFYLHKTSEKKQEIGYFVVLSGWIVAIATMLAALVGCHSFHVEHHDYDRIKDSSYLAFSRSAWTLGIVWIVWACVNGYGGPINCVLSSHLFRVLGRISYSIYLWHMLMQYLISGAAKTSGYFADFSGLYAGFSDLFIMVIIGFLFSVCFESPLVKSLGILIKAGKSNKVAAKHQKK